MTPQQPRQPAPGPRKIALAKAAYAYETKRMSTEHTPLKKGERIRIKPEWQEPGDDKREWFAYDDEHMGRVGIFTPMPGMAFQPWQCVSAHMVERVDGGLRDVAIELGLCAS